MLASTFQWTIALIIGIGGALNGALWYYVVAGSTRSWETAADVKVLRALHESSAREAINRIAEVDRRVADLRADVLRSQPSSRP